MTIRRTALDTATIREKSVRWQVSPASIVKVLLGGVVRGLAGHRIRIGLHADGLAHLAPHFFSEPFGSVPDAPGIASDPDGDETPADPEQLVEI